MWHPQVITCSSFLITAYHRLLRSSRSSKSVGRKPERAWEQQGFANRDSRAEFSLNSEVERREHFKWRNFPTLSRKVAMHKIQLWRSWISTMQPPDYKGYNVFERTSISEFRFSLRFQTGAATTAVGTSGRELSTSA